MDVLSNKGLLSDAGKALVGVLLHAWRKGVFTELGAVETGASYFAICNRSGHKTGVTTKYAHSHERGDAVTARLAAGLPLYDERLDSGPPMFDKKMMNTDDLGVCGVALIFVYFPLMVSQVLVEC